MKITNIKEFSNILYFAFSEKYNALKESEKESIKNEIAFSINKIDDAQIELIKQAKYDLKKMKSYYSSSSDYRQSKERILYIFSIITEEDRVNIVSEYVMNENNIRSYSNLDIKILIPMMDYISDDMKINVFSKSDSVDLFKFMGELNQISQNKRYKRNTRKKYAKYYEICQKALAKQNK